MKLLHIFPTFEVGGSQRRFATLVNEVWAAHDHEIISIDGREDARHLINDQVAATVRAGHGQSGAPLKAVRYCYRQLQATTADVLITYNWGAIEWALANRLVGIPHIHIEDGFGPEEAHGQLMRRVWTRRLALSGKSRLVVPSHVLEKIALESWHINSARVSYIPNGIETEKFVGGDRAVARARLDLPREALVIGTIAALRPEKNLARMIKAFARLGQTDATLVIAGDGQMLEPLRSHAQDLGVAGRVRFPGYIDEPADLFPAFDVFALSSDTEQMPISVLEAMASGVAVASTDVGDVWQMVSEANKPFVNGLNLESLLISLQTLCDNQQLREKLGADNRMRALEVFDKASMLRSYRDLLSPIIL